MTIELPKMLAFDRKLEVSDALMYSGKWGEGDEPALDQDWHKVAITTRQNRSTISAEGTPDEDKTKPNPVSSDNDDANLLHNSDTLKVSFTLRVIGGIGQPFGCNDPNFEREIKKQVNAIKSERLKELAHRYAHNIATARFLWRNRVSADRVTVQVQINQEDQGKAFDALTVPLNDFEASKSDAFVKSIADAIYRGLNSEDEFICLTINAYVRLGLGQHVFPSQVMNMGEKKKVLFKLDDCAAMHSVKVGNAIRTIDDWYNDAEFPIAVEPFGSVTQRGQAYRKSKIDLYSLMVAWVNETDIGEDQQCFVLANLIRGGVFGKSND